MSFIKIQANQSTISASQNLMDFEVPDYVAGVDLSESFININYRIDSEEVDAAVVGIHNYIKLFNGIGVTPGTKTELQGGSSTLFNSCLIRNISLSASNVGQLENIQRCDLISQVKQQFTKNVSDIQGESNHSIRSLPEEFNYPMDQSRNLRTEGTILSSEREGVMRVNLKDILGLGSATLNLQELGSLRLHVEANLNKFTLNEVPTFDATVPPVIKGGVGAYWKQTVAIPLNDVAPTTLTLSGGDAPDNQRFLTKKNCPFWVGQKVSFVLEPTGVTNTPTVTTITSMEWASNAATVGGTAVNYGKGAQVTLSFLNADPIFAGVVAGAAVTSIRMYPVYSVRPDITYTGAEMVIRSIDMPIQSKGLKYRTVETIQDFAGASSFMNRTYQIPQNAMTSLICFDTAKTSTEFSNSFEPNLTSYQVFVNNVGMTDRPVNIKVVEPKTKDPLHNIIMEKTLESMGLEYKNNLDVLPNQIKITPTDAIALLSNEIIPQISVFEAIAATGTNGVTVIPVMYDDDNQSKLINLDLQRDATAPAAVGVMNLVLFQEVERTINY
tara:strand:+ start:3377 stop:5041 length:1665 start_codon:yes stop_codon:yes gene_type:complete